MRRYKGEYIDQVLKHLHRSKKPLSVRQLTIRIGCRHAKASEAVRVCFLFGFVKAEEDAWHHKQWSLTPSGRRKAEETPMQKVREAEFLGREKASLANGERVGRFSSEKKPGSGFPGLHTL